MSSPAFKISVVLAAMAGFIAWKSYQDGTDMLTATKNVISSAGQMLTRGLRNNNPGNIRHGQPWQGLAAAQNDAAFATFLSPEYGIRAMAVTLKTYANSYGINTVARIIARWAPASENNTLAYIASVAGSMGVDQDAPLSYPVDLPGLIAAIIKHENGLNPYTAQTIADGVRLA